QRIDDAGQYSITELDVEAQPAAEAIADLDTAAIESNGEAGEGEDLIEEPDQTNAEAYAAARQKDSGDLYGVHTPHAEDKDLDKARNQESFKDADDGENW